VCCKKPDISFDMTWRKTIGDF